MNSFSSHKLFTLFILFLTIFFAQASENWSYVGGQNYHTSSKYSTRSNERIQSELDKVRKELGVLLWENGIDTVQFTIIHNGKALLFNNMWPVQDTLHSSFNEIFSRMSFVVHEDQFLTTVVTLIKRGRSFVMGGTPVHHEMPRSNEEITKFISRKRGALKRIFNKSHNRQVAAANDVTVQIAIAESGRVTSCHILDNDYVEDVEFEENILEKISGWKFREVNKSLGEMVIKMPLTFEYIPADYNNPRGDIIPVPIPLPGLSSILIFTVDIE